MLRRGVFAYLACMAIRIRHAAAVLTLLALSGCDMVVLDPAGDVAWQQRNLVIIATVLMLLIVLPVLAAVGLFAWRYRAGNTDARYEPEWNHSTQLELLIWAAPLLIIICLGAVTWTGSHLLDPYRPIERIAPGKPVTAAMKPLEVQVVSLDWKWLFIYPEYGFATVNEVAAPLNRPIVFRMTSSSVMNAFYIPTLAGMIYTMPSMETKLHAVINKPGNYAGFSSNYSGAGFSDMRFRFYGMPEVGFEQWVKRNESAPGKLTRANYLRLVKPSEKVPVMRFGAVAPSLFDAVVGQCVRPGDVCMQELMRHDMGDTSSMSQKSNAGGSPRAAPVRPLNSGSAGQGAPDSPADVEQRSPAAPGALGVPGEDRERATVTRQIRTVPASNSSAH